MKNVGADPIRLFVSDVDGTLVRGDKTLSPATIAAFGRLRAAGVQATLISARPPSGMLGLAKALDIRGPLGAFNGGVILRADGTIDSGHRLDPAVVDSTLERLEQGGRHLAVRRRPLVRPHRCRPARTA